MNPPIELSHAIQQLPLEAPTQSAWSAIQSHASKNTGWPKWMMSTAASTALAFVLFFQLSSTQQDDAIIAHQNTSQLNQLINRSAQMENTFYAQQDDSISSASVIAANLGIEDQLTAIDQQLSQAANPAQTISLWQSRIELLSNGIRLNKINSDLNSQGQNYDLALASIN
jgi:anti-sigma-K factor RskA